MADLVNVSPKCSPASFLNPLATGGPLQTTTGSSVYSFGGINTGVQCLPINAVSCQHPTASNPVCQHTGTNAATAGVAQNNSTLQAAAQQSRLLEYIGLGLLAIGAFFLIRHAMK